MTEPHGDGTISPSTGAAAAAAAAAGTTAGMYQMEFIDQRHCYLSK